MKKWTLSRRDSGEKISALEASLGVKLVLPKAAQVDCSEPEEGVVFVTVGGMTFVESAGKVVPFLGSQEALLLFPAATVDQGAIKFVINGADVMRPGIRAFDDWGDSGKMVVVREEGKGRAIAVGLTTVASEKAREMTKGSCIKSLHYVGDRFWTLHRTL